MHKLKCINKQLKRVSRKSASPNKTILPPIRREIIDHSIDHDIKPNLEKSTPMQANPESEEQDDMYDGEISKVNAPNKVEASVDISLNNENKLEQQPDSQSYNQKITDQVEPKRVLKSKVRLL